VDEQMERPPGRQREGNKPRLLSPELSRRLRRKLPPIVLVSVVVAMSAFLWTVNPVGGFSEPIAITLLVAWLVLFLSARVAHEFGLFAPFEYREAVTLEERGRLQEAERAYGRSIGRLRRRRTKNSSDWLRHCLVRRCYVLRELGRLPEALALADELVAVCEGRDDVGSTIFAGVGRTARAEILMGLGDSRGRQAFEDVFARYADHPEPAVRQVAAFAINKLGLWLDRSGDYDGAIANYDLAIYRFASESDPDIRCAVAEAIVNRGSAIRSTGRTLEAVSDHERVIGTYADDAKASSTVARAKTELGMTLMDLGRLSEALERFNEVVAFGSNDPGSTNDLLLAQALCCKGLALTQLGRPKEALAVYETVIATFVQYEAPAAVLFAREKVAILRGDGMGSGLAG